MHALPWALAKGITHRASRCLQKTAHVGPVDGAAILTAACPVRYFDLAAMSAADAEFTTDFTLHPTPSVRLFWLLL